MISLFDFFVQNPAAILLIAALFYGAYWILRRTTAAARPQTLLWPAVAWTLWAIWEFILLRVSPEANIRVDLLVIVPVVLLLSVIGIVRAFWPRRARADAT